MVAAGAPASDSAPRASKVREIQAALQASGGAPVETLQRQIDALRVEAARAQQLGQRMQRLLDVVAAGNETAASDWLDILELMNMYHKHMSDDEVGTLLDSGAGSLRTIDAQWVALIAEVRGCM